MPIELFRYGTVIPAETTRRAAKKRVFGSFAQAQYYDSMTWVRAQQRFNRGPKPQTQKQAAMDGAVSRAQYYFDEYRRKAPSPTFRKDLLDQTRQYISDNMEASR